MIEFYFDFLDKESRIEEHLFNQIRVGHYSKAYFLWY